VISINGSRQGKTDPETRDMLRKALVLSRKAGKVE
jgi:hypothetical protein